MKYTGISWGYFYFFSSLLLHPDTANYYNVIEHYVIFLLTILYNVI